MDAIRHLPIIVTLVHGTFDRDAQWTRPDSILCCALRKGLGEHVIISNFEWTGNNSQTDRQIASEQLLNRIVKNDLDFLHGTQVLIGHSHGGNIINTALSRVPARHLKSVAAAATISTPFLNLERRNAIIEVPALVYLINIALLTLFASLWFKSFVTHYEEIMQAIEPFLIRPFRNSENLAVYVLMLITAMVLIPVKIARTIIKQVLEKLEVRLIDKIVNRQRAYRYSLENVREKNSIKFLCLYTKTDEVKVLFGLATTAESMSRLTGAVAFLARSVHEKHFSRMSGLTQLFIAYILVIPVIVAFAGESSGHNISGLAQSLILRPLILFSSLVVGSCIVIIGVGSMVFGFKGWADFFGIKLSYAMAPVGVDNVTSATIQSDVIKLYLERKNTHTAVMYNKEVAQFVSNFCRNAVTN